MAQTYSDFKTFVSTFLWRENDTVLSSNLDVIIQMANDELDVILRDFQRRQKTAVIAPETQDFDLTANVSDFQAIVSLINNTDSTYYHSSRKTFQSTTLSHIYQLRAQNPGGPVMPYYAVDRDDGNFYLRLVGPFSAANPGDLTMVYRIGIPNYASADASWVEDEHLQLYLYTVLKHAALFVRDDEKIETYAALQSEAFTAMDMDDKHHLQFGGSPLVMRSHHRTP